MRRRKYYISLTKNERIFLLETLNQYRNLLIQRGRYTDAVDELIIKFS